MNKIFRSILTALNIIVVGAVLISATTSIVESIVWTDTTMTGFGKEASLLKVDTTVVGTRAYANNIGAVKKFVNTSDATSHTVTMDGYSFKLAEGANISLATLGTSDNGTATISAYGLAVLAGTSGGQTLIGGTGTTDDLIFRTTSGVGATGAVMQFEGGNNGATDFITILNSGAIGIGTVTSPVCQYLEIPGSQLNSSLKVGAFEVQSYAVNNGWVSDNIYYANGLGFIARSNGFGCMNYFYNGAYQVRVTASTLSAGATFTPKIPLVVNRNSSVSLGGDVSAGVGHVGSFFMIDSIGKCGIGTSVADKKLEINLGTADAFRLSYNDNNGSAANYMDVTLSSAGFPTFNATGTNPKFTFSDPVIMGATMELKAYTVATLPTGVEGAMAYVTDATAPTYLGTLTGGGSVKCPVFYNGSAWVSH